MQPSWCVELSRHQLGCIIVGRDGVGERLDEHNHDSDERPTRAQGITWHGWRAQQTLWTHLDRTGCLIRLGSGLARHLLATTVEPPSHFG